MIIVDRKSARDADAYQAQTVAGASPYSAENQRSRRGSERIELAAGITGTRANGKTAQHSTGHRSQRGGVTSQRDLAGCTRYDFLSGHLQDRDFLLDGFTVADAYLITTLGWAAPAGIDLAPWPQLGRYAAGLRARPAVARALGEELALAGRA